MLEQLAPSYWAAVNSDTFPEQMRTVITGDVDDLCIIELDRALTAVGQMCMVLVPAVRPCYAMGE
jgi:hypothetical protein